VPDRFIISFSGSWRSTVIIATSTSGILTSIIVLSALGETINIMTLADSLGVGILVDDATVEVENINRNREAEPERTWMKLSSTARRKSRRCFVSTRQSALCLLNVLAVRRRAISLCAAPEAVVFAMLASYLLSRTIVPTMAKYCYGR